MGKHTRPEDREYGQVCGLVATGGEPTVHQLRALVENFDLVMKALGQDAKVQEWYAHYARTPDVGPTFGSFGWYLDRVHSE